MTGQSGDHLLNPCEMRKGSRRFEVTGDGGQDYNARWVRQESNIQQPAAAVVGPTGELSLTLIPFGGAWNADIVECETRTVARAARMDVQRSETTSGT